MKTQQQRDDEDNDKSVITTGGNNTEPIPLDVEIEILKRLPAKSLMKFICVSKQWCSIIRSRSFADSFMSKSLSRPRFLFCYEIISCYENRLLFLSSPFHPQESNSSSSVSMVSRHDFPDSCIRPDRNRMKFRNFARGIICMSFFEDYLLCNPATRQVLRIPNGLTSRDHRYRYHNERYSFMCLGYDTSKDQFKILHRMMSLSGSNQHSVCTLERGQQSSFSSWRRLESDIVYDRLYTNVICINGVVYYGATKTKHCNSFVIVSFDVGSERFLLIEIPPKGEERSPTLINYQGKLACFCFDNKRYALHVLDDAEKQIWSTKKGVFTPFSDPYSNLGIRMYGATDDGGIIYVSDLSRSDFEIFYQDLVKNKVSKRDLTGEIEDDDRLRCLGYNVMRLFVTCDHVDNIISL